ncbi:MAG: hypothetical protein R3176_02940 [Woeseiaceae bacterium]|nr:hypothetical protein [Woeseiaceae bacterium]
MLKFLRSNPTIAAGILLPLVVAAFFVIATAIPRWLVAPPAHDLLFTVHDYRHESPAIEVRFDVTDDRVRARAFRPENSYRSVPRLYRYEHATDTVRELTVELPADNDFENGILLDMPALSGTRVSAARRAPDGYEITGPEYRGGGLMGLFFGRRRQPGLAISKEGAVFEIPDVDGRPFYYGSVSFLAWVVADDG